VEEGDHTLQVILTHVKGKSNYSIGQVDIPLNPYLVNSNSRKPSQERNLTKIQWIPDCGNFKYRKKLLQSYCNKFGIGCFSGCGFIFTN
jgi:hypothetical protein